MLIQDYLQENDLQIHRGTIVDGTIIYTPVSANNKDGQRDPEMRQTKKVKQWYFGMNAHIDGPGTSHSTSPTVITPSPTSSELGTATNLAPSLRASIHSSSGKRYSASPKPTAAACTRTLSPGGKSTAYSPNLRK